MDIKAGKYTKDALIFIISLSVILCGFLIFPLPIARDRHWSSTLEHEAMAYAKRQKSPQGQAFFPRYLVEKGNTYLKKSHDYAKAEEDFKLALKIDPNYTPAYAGMAMAYAGLNKDDDALKAFQLAFKDDRNLGDVQTNYAFAQLAHRKGFMEDEVKAYKRIFQKDYRDFPFTLLPNGMPDNETMAIVHLLVGEDIWLNVDMEAAKTEYLEAFNMRPKLLQTRVLLASRLGHVGLTNQKIQVLTQIARMAPGTKEGDAAKQELSLRGVTVAER